MTVQQLRYFIALAQHLHFGEAARACYVSQPSLSHSIAELEGELNLKLLYRDSRAVELTPAGRVFYDDATDIIKKLDEAVIRAKRADSGYSGSIHIGSLGGLSSDSFPAKILQFKRKNPNIDVNFTQTNMKTLNLCILKGSIDVALTRRLDVLSRADELQWKTLYQDRFGVLVQSDSPLAAAEKIDLKSLADEQFVFLEPSVTPNVYNYVISLCAARGLVPKSTYPAPTLEIVCTLVKAGMGIAIVPDCAMVYSSGELKFFPLEGDDALSDVVLAWRGRNINPIVPVFLNEFGIDVYSSEF